MTSTICSTWGCSSDLCVLELKRTQAITSASSLSLFNVTKTNQDPPVSFVLCLDIESLDASEAFKIMPHSIVASNNLDSKDM